MATNALPAKCLDCKGRGFTVHNDKRFPRSFSRLCEQCEGFGTLDQNREAPDFHLPTVRWSETIHYAIQNYGSPGMLEVRLIQGKLQLGHYRTMQDKKDRAYWTPLARLMPLESE